ncbi:hypothetical protein CIL05_01805 [Virgibacillus profundi]|uniref:DUF4181 domain-containing protein n=1 Tax=Virgibacillus profundi TaxID=2024555 RepID=A0A2A2IJH4_9BACI|nr:hypothetical protein [Virgibacillus profundi]PAV31414.1 hypothetical protein CIL05_01805 [Virgibacillus profundi]PXY55600.1 hypothetical protein CIT14_01815 [Virgibacillus profundi]
MRHPFEKFIRLELLSIVCVILFGLIALIQGYLLLIFLSLYLLAIGLLCNAMIEWYTHQSASAGKQVLRAIMIFLFTTYLMFLL